MLKRAYAAAVIGIGAKPVEIEVHAVPSEDPRTRVDLLHGLPEDVRRVALCVRLLEELLPGRIAPLADDEALVGREGDDGGAGGHPSSRSRSAKANSGIFNIPLFDFRLHLRLHLLNVLRCRAAAAADDGS